MKQFLIIFFLIVAVVAMYSQEFKGIHTSAYTPLVNVINQPADLTRDDARWNINLLSGEVGLLNNQQFASSNFWDVMAKVGFHDLRYFLASEESLVYINGRLIIPSISFKLNNRHSFGVNVSVRADGVYNSSNDQFTNIFNGIDNPEALKNLKDEYFKSLVSSWVEYGFIWSGTLTKTENSWLTGGVVLKILNGSGSGYLEMDGIDVAFNKERIEHFDMKVSYGFNESLGKTVDGGDIVEQSGDIGVGLDLGLSYSYKPDHLIGVKGVPYRYKVGVVVSDIGHITHRKTKNKASYHVSMNDVPYSRFEGIRTLEALKDSIERSIDINEIGGGSFKTRLPLNFAANLDYCIRSNWFVNFTFVFKPLYYHSTVQLTRKSVLSWNVTGRYETPVWGVYLPLSHSSVLGWSTGLSARYRNFFVGSSTMIGNLLGASNGQQLVYFGISIPIGSLDKKFANLGEQ